MEAIRAVRNIVVLSEASSPDEVDAAMMKAHDAVDALHLAKLKEMERDLSHRLGTESAIHQGAMGMVASAPKDEVHTEARKDW